MLSRVRMGLLEVNILTGKSSVDGREGVELVLEQVLVFGVKVASRQSKAPSEPQAQLTLGSTFHHRQPLVFAFQ